MPTFLQPRQERELYVEDFTAPLSQSFDAAWDTAASYGIFSGLEHENEKYWAQRFDPRKLTQEEIDDRVGSLPLKVEPGISENHLKLMIAEKEREMRNQRILARAKDTFIADLAHFSAGLGASITDPGDLLVSMVPVVGQARYAMMLERAGSTLGRAMVRARVGAAGGLVGAAAAEPLVYGMAQSRQADYDLYDSFLNITFGGIMGGGLHVAGGAIKDRFFRAPADSPTARIMDDLAPQTREEVLRKAYSDMASGYRIDVDHILGGDPRYSYLSGQRLGDPTGTTRASVKVTDEVLNQRIADHDEAIWLKYKFVDKILPKGEVKSLKSEIKHLEYEIAKSEKELAKRSKTDPVAIGHEKRRVANRKKLATAKQSLADSEQAKAARKQEIADVDKAKRIMAEKDRPDLAEWPEFLKRELDTELMGQHKALSMNKLNTAIRSTMKPKSERNSLALSPEQSHEVKMRVDEMKNKTDDDVLDEMLPEIEADIKRVSEDIDLTKELSAIDKSLAEVSDEINTMKAVAQKLAACGSLNG